MMTLKLHLYLNYAELQKCKYFVNLLYAVAQWYIYYSFIKKKKGLQNTRKISSYVRNIDFPKVGQKFPSSLTVGICFRVAPDIRPFLYLVSGRISGWKTYKLNTANK